MRRPWEVAKDIVRMLKTVRENVHKGVECSIGNIRVRENAETAQMVLGLQDDPKKEPKFQLAVNSDAGFLKEIWTFTVFEGGKEVRDEVANVLFHTIYSYLHIMSLDEDQLSVSLLPPNADIPTGDWARKAWSIDAIKVDVRVNLRPTASSSIPISAKSSPLVVEAPIVSSAKSSATPPFRPQSAPTVGSLGRSPQLPSSLGNDSGMVALSLPPASTSLDDDPMSSLAPIIDAPNSPIVAPAPFSHFFDAGDEPDSASRSDQLHALITLCRTARLTTPDVKPLEMLNSLTGN
jgi:hypothetical protein